MFSFIPAPYNWIAAAIVALLLTGAGAAGGYYVTHNADTVKYQALQLADSKAQTANISASLSQLQGFITNMHTADAGYNDALAAINAHFDNIQKELSNAIAAHPLPLDCKPDAGRLRVLTDAVSAANAGASAGK